MNFDITVPKANNCGSELILLKLIVFVSINKPLTIISEAILIITIVIDKIILTYCFELYI